MSILADDDSPVFVGDTGAPFAPQFLHKDGTPVNLTGATITMKLQQIISIGTVAESVGVVKTAAGTWTIDDAMNGKAHYVYAAGDVDTPGTWNRYITITIGGLPLHADDGAGNPKPLVIEPAP